MILYHMDRSGCFPTSGELSLHPLSDLPHDIAASRFFLDFQSGVSKHCLNYFTDNASMLIAIQSPCRSANSSSALIHSPPRTEGSLRS